MPYPVCRKMRVTRPWPDWIECATPRLWELLVKKHNLQPIPYEQLVRWDYGNFVFTPEFDIISSTIKAKQYGFVAQVDALFAEPAADLLRRPAHLAQLCLDPTPQRRSQLAGLTPYCLACLSLRFRLLEPIAPLPPIAAHLSGHRALAYA